MPSDRLITVVPTPELVARLRAAANDLDAAKPCDHASLREAADQIERAEASRRRVLMGGGL